MSLIDLFDLILEGSSDQTALDFGGRKWTFGDLDTNSNRLAHYLTANGFHEGDRIAVYLNNSIELIEAYLAAIKLGVIFTPINALYRQREIEHILSDATPRAILTSLDLSQYLPSSARFLLVEQLVSQLKALSVERPACPATGDSIAALVYTSGTTGRPKGAALTHDNFALNALTLNTCWQMRPSDRMLMALPLFHVNGLANGLHTWFTVGFRVRLLPRFRKESILSEFLDFQPTFFFGVPTMYERLLDVSPEDARRVGRTMRLFVSGSAPLPAPTLERFRRLYGHTILERYGMSETLGTICNPYIGERRPGTVGKPLPGVSVRLSDGDSGEVLVKSPTVFAGYWHNDEATKAAFTADGYFRTGDLAVRSADGYYTLQGRKTELIISGGFNIYPQEIEELLREQPAISEAVIVGEPDPIRGQCPVAYVVADPAHEFDVRALRQVCRAKLASYKVPREFRLRNALPKDTLGKIQRYQLKQSDEPEVE